jgi:hypothetical protein
VPQEHPHRREKLFGSSSAGVIPALLLDEATKLLSRKTARIMPQAMQEIHQMIFISSQRSFSYPAVLPHPRQELQKQGRSNFLTVYNHGWQNADPSQMLDKPLSPPHDERRLAAFGSRALALR